MKIKETISEHLNHLRALGRSEKTVMGARYDLGSFLKFLQSVHVLNVDELNADVMADYQQELAFRPTARGTLLSLRTQAQLLGVVKGFTRFLKQKEYLLHDPGQSIKLPRKPKTLPKVILTEAEVKLLMDAVDLHTNTGYRNRIVLEILYDTAIRRAEICTITLSALDLTEGYIHILGKGNKERMVPLSRRVCELANNYILAVRPSFIQGEDSGYLILNRWGRKMNGSGIWNVVKQCARLAGIKKNVTTHTFRHTCATHMLKNGAPIRHLQEMLGHESLESTQIYTRVTINDLKKIHARYHPGENLA